MEIHLLNNMDLQYGANLGIKHTLEDSKLIYITIT